MHFAYSAGGGFHTFDGKEPRQHVRNHLPIRKRCAGGQILRRARQHHSGGREIGQRRHRRALQRQRRVRQVPRQARFRRGHRRADRSHLRRGLCRGLASELLDEACRGHHRARPRYRLGLSEPHEDGRPVLRRGDCDLQPAAAGRAGRRRGLCKRLCAGGPYAGRADARRHHARHRAPFALRAGRVRRLHGGQAHLSHGQKACKNAARGQFQGTDHRHADGRRAAHHGRIRKRGRAALRLRHRYRHHDRHGRAHGSEDRHADGESLRRQRPDPLRCGCHQPHRRAGKARRR